jgi:hypothetical protein
VAATEGRSSPRKHLEKEGTEGNLTTALVGAGVVRFGRATARQSGGGPSSVGGQYGADGASRCEEWEGGVETVL